MTWSQRLAAAEVAQEPSHGGRVLVVRGASQTLYKLGENMCTAASLCMALKLLDIADPCSGSWPSSHGGFASVLNEVMSAGSRLQKAALESPNLPSLRAAEDERCKLLSVWEVIRATGLSLQRIGADLHEYVIVEPSGSGVGGCFIVLEDLPGVMESLSRRSGRHSDGPPSPSRGARKARRIRWTETEDCNGSSRSLPASRAEHVRRAVACILTCQNHSICVGLCGDGSYVFFDSGPSVLKAGLDRDGMVREVSHNRGLPLASVVRGGGENEHLCDATMLCRAW